MKERIELPAKYRYPIYTVIFGGFIGMASFLMYNTSITDKEIRLLSKTEIKGTIQVLKDTGRGTCYIEIKEADKVIKQHALSIAWEVEKYGIQVGDSVSKEANSPTTTFYRCKNGGCNKICTYELTDRWGN